MEGMHDQRPPVSRAGQIKGESREPAKGSGLCGVSMDDVWSLLKDDADKLHEGTQVPHWTEASSEIRNLKRSQARLVSQGLQAAFPGIDSSMNQQGLVSAGAQATVKQNDVPGRATGIESGDDPKHLHRAALLTPAT
jgi:hypothetical protein